VPVRPGLSATVDLVVTEADTAISMSSGDVPVLATPRIVALCEQAACKSIEQAVAAGETSVGMSVQLDHLAPTAIGGRVTAEATLEKVQGRRLVFTVTVNDRRGLVAAGRVTRVLVNVTRFLEKAGA
jgi:predicted thioesterase